MAIIEREDRPEKKKEIDLSGPQGNAFYLLGTAKLWADQLNLDSTAILKDMESDDYDHLIEVFDKHFGSICNLIK